MAGETRGLIPGRRRVGAPAETAPAASCGTPAPSVSPRRRRSHRSRRGGPGRRFWLAPAASALATAMIMLLWIAPSLPTAAPPDPLRPLAGAVINEHARTILWGESRTDVVPAVLAARHGGERRVAQLGVHGRRAHPAHQRAADLSRRPPRHRARLSGRRRPHRDLHGPARARPSSCPSAGASRSTGGGRSCARRAASACILWKQQGLLCVLICRSRLRRRSREAEGVLRQGPLVDGAVRGLLSQSDPPAGGRAAGRPDASRATTKGSAIRAHATMTTSESPKLYSDRPADEKSRDRRHAPHHERPRGDRGRGRGAAAAASRAT